MFVVDPLSFLDGRLVLRLAVLLLLLELGCVPLQNLVFLGDLLSLGLEILQLEVEAAESGSQLTFFLRQLFNVLLNLLED